VVSNSQPLEAWQQTQTEYAGPKPPMRQVPIWEFKVRYTENPAGPLRGTETRTSNTPPSEGEWTSGAFGRCYVTSKRPKRVGGKPEPVNYNAMLAWESKASEHCLEVVRAMRAGLPVPERVLADYPDLFPRQSVAGDQAAPVARIQAALL
jgi:hypothetical protein